MQPVTYCTLNFHVVMLAHVRSLGTPVKASITHKLNMIRRQNSHQSTSLAELQKALEAHGYKPWVTNLSIIVPHTLGILATSITYGIPLLDTIT